MLLSALSFAVLWLARNPAAVPAPASPAGAPWALAERLLEPVGPVRHDLHMTHSRVVVDGARVLCRIRLFHDDLQLALRRFSGRPNVVVGAASPQDSLFGAYFATRVTLRADGVPLTAKVLRSGPDPDAKDTPMWWYEVEVKAARPILALGVRFSLMFEHFDDQRNIITLLRSPGEERHSLYFAAGDDREQEVRFDRTRE